ncbi:MAG TPA: ferritin-like domain-containing protein [Candidatus Aquilonibacter sp.]|nr:ferritin-like domain-containing protein [Candidatus Aquilonibacter sp.]
MDLKKKFSTHHDLDHPVYHILQPTQQSTGKPEENFVIRGKLMTENSLKQLYVQELKDLYSAETQLTKALPKMAKAASSEELQQGFAEHLEQTKGHIERLQKIFDMLDEKATGKKCLGMEGLVKEGAETMEGDFEDAVMDSALISAAQRVEHYEIAGYGTVIAFAELLGESEQASLLRETLEEEKETDEKLTELAQEINTQANGGDSEDEDVEKAGSDEEEQPQRGKRKVRRAA